GASFVGWVPETSSIFHEGGAFVFPAFSRSISYPDRGERCRSHPNDEPPSGGQPLDQRPERVGGKHALRLLDQFAQAVARTRQSVQPLVGPVVPEYDGRLRGYPADALRPR